jgi:hypothetical protein
MAVEQFDEGVYASNIFFGGGKGDEHYPDQYLYAPPLVPLVIEFTMLAVGASNLAAILVNVVAGSLTIPLVWWVGRRWWGPAAGLASATLVALNDIHIFFCRTALTDVLLCFWIVLAVYLFWEAETTRSRAALVGAGLSTGLSWWTKYNGWLPLAICLAGLIPWRLACGGRGTGAAYATSVDQRPLARSLGIWAVMALLAFLGWAPCLWNLEAKGGYAAVARNHRGYLIGLSGWWHSLTVQAAKLRHLDGWLSCSALVVVLVATILSVCLLKRRCTWNVLLEHPLIAIWLILLGAASISVGPSGGLAILALGGVVAALAPWDQNKDRAPSSRQLNGWLLAAWFVGLLAAVPFYTPYPRLTLPWLTSCWLGAGTAVSILLQKFSSPAGDRPSDEVGFSLPVLAQSAPQPFFPWKGLPLIVALAAAVLSIAAARPHLVPGWQPRTSLLDQGPLVVESACRSAGVIPPDGFEQIVIYTYADPALMFQLRLAGLRWVRPVKDLAVAGPDAPTPRLPSFVVIGPQCRRSPGFEEQFAMAKRRLALVGSFAFRPSDLVLLDAPELPESRVEAELELYRVK